MAVKNDTRLRVTKRRRRALVKIEGLWVHRGSLPPGEEWDRLVEKVRDGRIVSVLKARMEKFWFENNFLVSHYVWRRGERRSRDSSLRSGMTGQSF
jgi:hypothetical protein